MKKFLFIALCAFSLIDVAQAQKAAAPPQKVAKASITQNDREFKQETAKMKGALNANNFTEAESLWVNIYRLMSKRGDELRKINGDVAGSDKRYEMTAKLKNLAQNMSGNKAAMIQLLSDMDANY